MALQKREKRLLIGLAIVAVVSAVILYRIYRPSSTSLVIDEGKKVEKKSDNTPSQSSNASSSSSSPRRGSPVSSGSRSSSSKGGGSAQISMSEFQQHTQAQSCWVLIEGEVYDISNFLYEYSLQQETALDFCGTVGFEAGFLENDALLRESVKEKSIKIGTIG